MTDFAASNSSDLLIRLPNWVGDVCMALPAITALKEAGLRPTLLGKGWIRDLLVGLDLPLVVLPKGLKATRRAIAATGIRDGLLFTNSFGSALSMRLGGVRAVGYRNELRSPLLAAALPKIKGQHEAQVFWHLAQAVLKRRGLPTGPEVPPWAVLPVLDVHRAEAAAALAKAGVSGPYTVLCPLAVGQVKGRSKVWASFPLLCRMLTGEGATVIACPGPGEEAACAAALPGVTPIAGLGLGAYAAVMAGAQRVVANDSGPMHLAAAIGAPVLGIFGVTDPQRTHPWAAHAHTLGSAHGFPTVNAVWDELKRMGEGTLA